MRLRFPGYGARRPDPPSRGVMSPPPAAPPRPRLPRLRFHPLCWVGRHKPYYYRLHATGEKWSTFIYTCLRCNRVVGDSHAAIADVPVTGNK